MNSKEKTVKTVKTLLSVLWWIAVAVIAILMFSIIGAKMRGKVPCVFGFSVINIVSGSMEDEIPVGSYILVKSTKPEKIKKGDVICFYSDDPDIYGLPNTHRVVEEPIVGENGIEFVTRGDANPSNDEYNARGDALIGKYVGKLGALNGFSDMLDGGGMFVIIIVLQVLIFGIAAYTMVIKSKAQEQAEEAPENEDNGLK